MYFVYNDSHFFLYFAKAVTFFFKKKKKTLKIKCFIYDLSVEEGLTKTVVQ